MANHRQQGPEGNYDPAGSTQMFRAFVDEGQSGGRAAAPAAARRSGPGVGVIVGVIVAIAVVAGVAWLALS
ncbi:hypothetical protein AB8O64_19140 [Streptomyces sp. QH1-20]|uniref:hypothetical protein n=1 Tax=Streptomyces sp. QH1-20 TaxID=3240934 RepID=UPI001015C72C|nr:hypothetical protein SNS2_2131 [Streptomyces netropsis]